MPTHSSSNNRTAFYTLLISFCFFFVFILIPSHFNFANFSNHVRYRALSGKRCYHGYWQKRKWRSSQECPTIKYTPRKAADCLYKRAQRIVMIGDSVHRQLFVSMFHYFRTLQYENNRFEEPPLSASKNGNGWNISIHKRFDDKSFTNFKDEDIIVKKGGKTMFSIRFVYASNAIDFPGRCKSIKTWFFQCLKSFQDILISVSTEEAKRINGLYAKKKAPRKSSNSMQGRYVDDEFHDVDINRPKISAHDDEVDSDKFLEHELHKEMQMPSVAQTTILYINTGLWDWRTGLLPKNIMIT